MAYKKSHSNKQLYAARIPRTARVASQIHRVLAEAVFELAQKEAADNLLTVTAVDLSGDLKTAKVYFSSLSETELEFLNTNRIKLQQKISQNVHMKVTPILSFYEDPVIAGAQKIDEILSRISQKRKSDPEADFSEPKDVSSGETY